MSVNSRQFFMAGSLFLVGGIALGVQQQSAVRPATVGQQPAAAPARATISGLVTRAGTGEPVRKASVTLLPTGGGQGGNRAQGAGQLPPQPGQPAPNINPQAPAGQGQQVQAQQARGGQQGQGQQGGRQGGGGGGGGAVSVTSGDDGAFTIKDVPAGTYRIRVDRDGYLSQEYGQRSWTGSGIPVTVQPGQTLQSLTFQLIQGGTIAGRIVDENLEPVAGLQVEALAYVYQNGTRTLISERQVTTNDLGEYRLYWLTPGDHYVSAIPNSRRGGLVQAAQNFQRGGRGGAAPNNPQNVPEEAYAPLFYPGSIDPENAAPVRLAAASEMRGIDFVLRPTRMAKISGRVIAATITPTTQQLQQQAQQQGRGNRGQNGGGRGGQGGVQVVLTRVGGAAGGGRGQGGGGGRGGRGLDGIQSLAQVNPADGTFEIANVVPGTYNLMALQPAQNQVYSARVRVDVGPADIGGITLAVRPGVEIPGEIFVEGTPPANFRMNGIRVSLTSLDNLPFGNANAQVDANGKFTLPNIPTMTYRVNVQGMPAGSYLIAGRFGSTDALAEPLSVEQTGTLSLQLGFSPGQVTGAVTDNAGRPFPAAITVLIPAARGRTDLYKTTNSDANGRVNFTNVAPGDYKVIAWEDVPQGAYLNADFVAPYEDRAQSVHVDRNTSPSFQVRVIPRNEQ